MTNKEHIYVRESDGPIQTLDEIPKDTTVLGHHVQLNITKKIGDNAIIHSRGKPNLNGAEIGKGVICFEHKKGERRVHKWLITQNGRFEHALAPTEVFQQRNKAKSKPKEEAREETNCCKPCAVM